MLTKKEIELLYKKKEVLISLLQIDEVRTIIKLLLRRSDLSLKDQYLFDIDSGHYENVSFLIDELLLGYSKNNSETTAVTTTEENELWLKVLDRLSQVISRQSYDMWLKDTKLLKISGITLHISASTSFARDWLEERYTDTVNEILNEVCDQNYEVKFVCPTSVDS